MTKRENMNGVIIAGFILALTILVSAYIPEVTIFDTDNLIIFQRLQYLILII